VLNDRLSEERGNVIVTAILVLSIMMAIGLAALSRVDGQTQLSGKERQAESTFNLSEGALTQQSFILGRRGTGTATTPYPPTCGSDAPASSFCPDPAKLALNYDAATQNDFAGATRWRTWVRDNASGAGVAPDTFWSDTLVGDVNTGVGGRPRYDQNEDKLMWVRTQAEVRGRQRAIVGLIRIEPRPIRLPAHAILAGRFKTTNNGNHSAAIVDTTGSQGVTVRCGPPNGSGEQPNCLEYESKRGQITPNLTQTGYSGDSTLSADDLDALLDVARANGTFYTSKPASLSGDVVVLDPGGATEWKYTGNDTFNSPANPGVVILLSGKIELNGTVNYHGLIFHANLSNSSDSDLVKIHGNSQLAGAVIVEGKGGVEAGSSGKLNIDFDGNALQNVNAFGTAGVVQNTWREIVPLDLP
jgi:Tfp pilus assembly protein PilX